MSLYPDETPGSRKMKRKYGEGGLFNWGGNMGHYTGGERREVSNYQTVGKTKGKSNSSKPTGGNDRHTFVCVCAQLKSIDQKPQWQGRETFLLVVHDGVSRNTSNNPGYCLSLACLLELEYKSLLLKTGHTFDTGFSIRM